MIFNPTPKHQNVTGLMSALLTAVLTENVGSVASATVNGMFYEIRAFDSTGTRVWVRRNGIAIGSTSAAFLPAGRWVIQLADDPISVSVDTQNIEADCLYIPSWGWVTRAEFDRINQAMTEEARDLEETRKPY